MKKRVLPLFLVVVMLLSISAQAGIARSPAVQPKLTLNGTSATCSVMAMADHATDEVSVVMKLWQGSTCLETWTDSGDGYVYMSESATVSTGSTYRLTVTVSINGVARPTVSTSASN